MEVSESEGGLILKGCTNFENGCPDEHFKSTDFYKCKCLSLSNSLSICTYLLYWEREREREREREKERKGEGTKIAYWATNII